MDAQAIGSLSLDAPWWYSTRTRQLRRLLQCSHRWILGANHTPFFPYPNGASSRERRTASILLSPVRRVTSLTGRS